MLLWPLFVVHHPGDDVARDLSLRAFVVILDSREGQFNFSKKFKNTPTLNAMCLLVDL